MTETIGYRSIVAAQSGSWLLGQILKAYFAVELRRPAGLFEHGSESCLILASMHKSVLDPFLIMSALRYRHWRALIPVRTLATQRVIHRTVNSRLASCTFSVEPERTLCRSRSGRAGGYGRAAAT